MRVLLRLGYLGRLLFFKNIFSYYILFLLHFLNVCLFISHCHCTGFSLVAGSRGYPLLQCEGFSWLWILLFWATALGDAASVAAIPGLQGTGSVIAMLGLRRSMACGIFPHQGSNLRLLHWQAGSLPLSHQRSPGKTSPTGSIWPEHRMACQHQSIALRKEISRQKDWKTRGRAARMQKAG